MTKNTKKLINFNRFVEEFLHAQSHAQKSELYELLLNYMRVRKSLQSAEKLIESKLEDVKDKKARVWEVTEAEITGEAECHDNKKVKPKFDLLPD